MKLWGAIAAGLIRRGGAVLISIRDAQGSTPREAGTRMVVFADGTFSGTIGGGTLEWRAIAEAQRVLNARKPTSAPDSPVSSPANSTLVSSPASPQGEARGSSPGPRPADCSAEKPDRSGDLWTGSPWLGFRLAGDDTLDVGAGTDALVTAYSARSYALGPELGQCCGGRVTLTFEVIRPEAIDAVRALADREADGSFVTSAELDGDQLVRRIVPYGADTSAERLETFGDAPRTLVLFGAGHVGRALVLALSALPFHVIWVDGRRDAFPAAVPANVTLVSPADPVTILGQAPADSFVLIMTHSHALDLALCDAALRSSKFPHVGVIGSATKRARFERRLLEAGVARAAVDRLVCPIGTPGPKSKLPQIIAATTVVELLMKDEAYEKAGERGTQRPATGSLAWRTARG